ncbi:hypothetical protein [Mycoplasmopsis felis]|uniref:hypothetical protein n=1 Tax=Mycoplasmopsis felis TaxID=33923 RepID=UPI002AFE32B2|nr:hypothetical protein [Mycoplasmopsis felis]WQQ07075.1 hypothetical protein RRG37_00345 [Mycoplasmopsis felis]
MSVKIYGKCNICLRNWMYMFGFDKSLEIYSSFLEDFKKFQKNLLDKNEFDEFYKDKINQENKEEILNLNYMNIMEFFTQQEKELLKNKILIDYKIEYTSVFKLNDIADYREVFVIPIIQFKFLNSEFYQRQYDYDIKFVEYDVQNNLLTCPYDLKLSSQIINKEDL